MTESAWGKPYNEPFELDTPVTAWRIEAIEFFGEYPYLQWCLPQRSWSPRARCVVHQYLHTSPPHAGCSCGYRIVRDLATLTEYWQRTSATVAAAAKAQNCWMLTNSPALVRVEAAGRAQTYDTEHNLTRHNCLSVEFIRAIPGHPIYTPAAEHAELLSRMYRTDVIVVDPDTFPAIPGAEP